MGVNADGLPTSGRIGEFPYAPGLTPLPGPALHIALWWCDLDEWLATEIQPCAEWLAPAERARADRFGTNLLRDRYVAGRATLRLLLGHALGVAPADVPLQRGRRGRPKIAGDNAIDFNVSHTQGVALIGIVRNTDKCLRIGVDVERTDRNVGADRLAPKFLTSDEARWQSAFSPEERRQRFLRYWTCKEAMSKATGDGLIAPFRQVGVGLADPPRLIAGPPPYVPEAWQLHAVRVPNGYFAALAVWTPLNVSNSG